MSDNIEVVNITYKNKTAVSSAGVASRVLFVISVKLLTLRMIIMCTFVAHTESSMLESEVQAVARWPDGVC